MSLFDQFNWQGSRGFPYFWGYYWLGPINPHILPPFTGFTDNVTGTIYYLILNAAGDHLQLTTAAPPGPQRILAKGDYLYMGQFGVGLQVVNGHLVATLATNVNVTSVAMPVGAPGPFAPNTEAGLATLIGGLYLSGLLGVQNPAPLRPHISVTVGTIAAKATPTEPQIPPSVTYQGYYYELQDAKNSGKLS